MYNMQSGYKIYNLCACSNYGSGMDGPLNSPGLPDIFVFCSRFVRGLVFKKHAAHKHMPTKYDKPRLLLIEGALGLSRKSELSSFESMRQVNKKLSLYVR